MKTVLVFIDEASNSSSLPKIPKNRQNFKMLIAKEFFLSLLIHLKEVSKSGRESRNDLSKISVFKK